MNYIANSLRICCLKASFFLSSIGWKEMCSQCLCEVLLASAYSRDVDVR